MKACWKEDAQAVASEPQEETSIEDDDDTKNIVLGLFSNMF